MTRQIVRIVRPAADHETPDDRLRAARPRPDDRRAHQGTPVVIAFVGGIAFAVIVAVAVAGWL